jgi:hypothetical protein
VILLIGYWLSGAIAVAVMVIGARIFFAPYLAATAYGISVGRDPRWEDAYLIIASRFNSFRSSLVLSISSAAFPTMT